MYERKWYKNGTSSQVVVAVVTVHGGGDAVAATGFRGRLAAFGVGCVCVCVCVLCVCVCCVLCVVCCVLCVCVCVCVCV